MSKFLGLREEHMDLYGTVSAGSSYTSGRAFTSTDSYGTAIKGNVLELMADDVALWRVKLLITTTFTSAGSATMGIALKASNALSSGNLSSPDTVYSKTGIALTDLTAGTWLLDLVLKGYKYCQVEITPGTAAFTAGTVKGWVEPEFN